ncbi:GNAT family N-acetyltransferase [Rhizobium alvei]|uniref:GNAT family N-acetyltransferase n=1 Tax=Rhizobium alvei TaxID=1132659 RepID=A0ABT8YJT9_9HYPH|nr:GNAT family N-acetyltransferase [Rhizobium alvei]MDO6963973.1 GNAT family N-acetyltransferase [Rhizobium alvei]
MAVPSKKPKAVKAHITRLEMTAPPHQSLSLPSNLNVALMRVEKIPAAYYRYLYLQVGQRWHWVDRLRMSGEALEKLLHDPRSHITVLYVDGAPAGFAEYFQTDSDTIELCHFGLMEHALGLGVGKWFLLQVLYGIWGLEPKTVTVTTNTLDHPRALQLYQMFGFNPVATSDALVRPLSDEELLSLMRPAKA